MAGIYLCDIYNKTCKKIVPVLMPWLKCIFWMMLKDLLQVDSSTEKNNVNEAACKSRINSHLAYIFSCSITKQDLICQRSRNAESSLPSNLCAQVRNCIIME